MFTVHLDESYGAANAYAVAGYVATVEQWKEFEREWNQLCEEVNVRYIHKEELEHLWGEFRYAQDWPKEEQKQLQIKVNSRACGILLRRVNAGFGAAVCKSDWIAADKGRWASTLGESFYAAGVFACFRLIATWMEAFNRNEPMRYILEAGAEGRREVEAMLKLAENSPEAMAMSRMGGWSFEYKKDRVIKNVTYHRVVPLQAADFLAYEIYRHMDNRGFEGIKLDRHGNEIRIRWPLIKLFQRDNHRFNQTQVSELPTPYFLMFIDKPKLAEMVTQLDQFFGVAKGFV
jgi:Protein of unknown function (DUF3800)